MLWHHEQLWLFMLQTFKETHCDKIRNLQLSGHSGYGNQEIFEVQRYFRSEGVITMLYTWAKTHESRSKWKWRISSLCTFVLSGVLSSSCFSFAGSCSGMWWHFHCDRTTLRRGLFGRKVMPLLGVRLDRKNHEVKNRRMVTSSNLEISRFISHFVLADWLFAEEFSWWKRQWGGGDKV